VEDAWFIFDVEALEKTGEVVEGDDGRDRDEDPSAVATRASAMPPETAAIPPDPVAAIPRKALMIPTTVPKRPMNGAVEPIVASHPSPRRSSIIASILRCSSALLTISSWGPGRFRAPSRSRSASARRDHLRDVRVLMLLEGLEACLTSPARSDFSYSGRYAWDWRDAARKRRCLSRITPTEKIDRSARQHIHQAPKSRRSPTALTSS
jgi:hypothetical protein